MIPDAAFDGITSYSVTAIGAGAFAFNVLTSVMTIPDSVTSIGKFAFFGNFLTSVDFKGNFGDCQLDVLDVNPNLATITY